MNVLRINSAVLRGANIILAESENKMNKSVRNCKSLLYEERGKINEVTIWKSKPRLSLPYLLLFFNSLPERKCIMFWLSLTLLFLSETYLFYRNPRWPSGYIFERLSGVHLATHAQQRGRLLLVPHGYGLGYGVWSCRTLVCLRFIFGSRSGRFDFSSGTIVPLLGNISPGTATDAFRMHLLSTENKKRQDPKSCRRIASLRGKKGIRTPETL